MTPEKSSRKTRRVIGTSQNCDAFHALVVRMREMYMNAQEEPYANETIARLIAYLSPYLFWGMVGVICASVWLLR